jgi:hypothetical protein
MEKLYRHTWPISNHITITGVDDVSGNIKDRTSTLDELIKEKEDELSSLRKLKTKRAEIKFFRGIASVSNSVAMKLEKGESLGPTERLFRERMFEGLSIKELLSLFFDKIFRQRKAVIFTVGPP